jgi:xanthine dehydrogenase molybdenum-binding subunit
MTRMLGREITLIVNGTPRHVRPRHGEPLLVTLREQLGVISVKDGCRPEGQCGACTAIVRGHARVTCTLPTESLDGAEIVTLEGIAAADRELLARAFAAAGAAQCGFCIPAIALHATALVAHHPSPTRGEIAKALDVHLCRCTGYAKILDAVELFAKAKRGERIPAPLTEGGVGAPVVRAEASPLGGRVYIGDLARPGMLHGAVVLSAHARADVLAIDVTRAAALPGVVAIVTAADVPGERWYGLLIPDWPGFVAVGEEVRCGGDVLAAIAAEDEATAREAAKLVDVTYAPKTPVLDPEEALREGAPRVNPKHENLLSRSILQRGDADAALAASAHVVRETFVTPRIEHLFLEPECALAEPLPDGRLLVHTEGQGIFDDRRQIAAFLGEPEDRVVVSLMPAGGAFGGKEDLSIQAHAALLARKTGRPVRLALDRAQSIRMHPKRHPMTLDYTVGCDAEGRLTAVRARIVGDSGAYASVGAKVLERAAGHACGPYRVPAVAIESLAVYTNNPPCGAMRGFGVPQASFAIEGCLDRLAEKIGLDGWEIRHRNALRTGDTLATGQVLEKSVGLERTLRAVRGAYEEARARGRAVGIACGMKNSGLGNGAVERAGARLAVERDGTVTLTTGFSEMGQGLFTALVQMAAEITALPASAFRPRADTEAPVGSGQTTGSRGTLLGGRALVEAAKKLRADLDGGAALGDLAGRVYDGETIIADTTPLGSDAPRPKTHTSYGFATQVVILDEAGRVARVVAAHDVGRAINPVACAAQIEGAIAMGLGYALTEELPCPGGVPDPALTLREIGALRAHDMPEMEVILVEEPEPEGPFGAKGVGEIGLVPTASAVAGAIAAFEGKRRVRLPMKDSAAARATSAGHYHPHHKERVHHEPHPRGGEPR